MPLLVLLGLFAAPAAAQDPAEATAAADSAAAGGPGVAVERFEFWYGLAHPELPPLAELNDVPIRLDRADGVWRAPTGVVTASSTAETVTLGSLPADSRFDASALRLVAEEVVRWFNARDLYGVWVAFRDLEAGATGVSDRRSPEDRSAQIVIWASQVAEVRTLARGRRFKPEVSVNHRKHSHLVRHSPLQPGATPEDPGSLFRTSVLNEYLFGLSLHPGRLVEASIASAGEPGKVVLDYLVHEAKTWQVFGQVTNFGTEATGEWRGRLGFQHNELTNHDDILNVDAISSPDLETYGAFLSYRLPVFRPALLHVRVFGSYGDFLASDATLQNLRFAGRNWLAGIEFTNRLSLPRGWQLVSQLGANYPHYEIESRINEIPLVAGYSEFLIPFVGTTASGQGRGWTLTAGLRVDHTVGDFANLNTDDGISALGRISPDAEWTSLRWNLQGTLYLERLFRGAEARHLANEVSLRVRGRHLLRGSRLIPHEQEPIGGAATVRGYAESVLAADEFITASVEYALHVPHLLGPGEPGKLLRWPFRWRPARAGQKPDWDLIARAFYDFADRSVTPVPPSPGQPDTGERALSERDVTLAGAGVGLELVVLGNFSLRCDVGMALTELRDKTLPTDQQVIVPAGDVRYYISSSFSW